MKIISFTFCIRINIFCFVILMFKNEYSYCLSYDIVLISYLQELYYLGARKFVVFEIAAIGCFPAILNKVKPKTRCVEDTNKLVSIFNKKLANELNLLSTILEGSTFTKAESYRLTYNMLKHPARYGEGFVSSPLLHIF